MADFIWGDYSLTFKTIEASSDLKNRLSRSETNAILLPEDWYARDCNLIKVKDIKGKLILNIGVIGEWTCILPVLPEELWILYSNYCCVIDLADKKLKQTVDLADRFIIAKKVHHGVIIICETSVYYLDFEGRTINSKTVKGRIEDYSFENGNIIVFLDNGTEVSISY